MEDGIFFISFIPLRLVSHQVGKIFPVWEQKSFVAACRDSFRKQPKENK
jgi:hypothetical protein